MATETTGNPSPQDNEPWKEDWSHSKLYIARQNATSQAEQNSIANAEHQAFARESTADNPLMAAPLLAAIPVYQGAKALGLTNSRSEPSLEQAASAYRGVGEGLSKSVVEPWKGVWNEAVASVNKAGAEVAKTVVDKAPWLVDWMTPPAKNYTNEAAPKQSSNSVFNSIFSKLTNVESQGQHTDAQGNLITSNKGAQGITQVLPKVGKDPGFGVQPLQNNSEQEYLRFGRDYLQAMLKEFGGDYQKALAAYNNGVGNVKKAITKGGEDWLSYTPKETQKYVNKILGNK